MNRENLQPLDTEPWGFQAETRSSSGEKNISGRESHCSVRFSIFRRYGMKRQRPAIRGRDILRTGCGASLGVRGLKLVFELLDGCGMIHRSEKRLLIGRAVRSLWNGAMCAPGPHARAKATYEIQFCSRAGFPVSCQARVVVLTG